VAVGHPGTIIPVAAAAARRADPATLFVDCRADIRDHGRGRRDYEAGHVAGAVFADLETQLAGPVMPGRTGRHPLPTPEAAVAVFSALGIGPDTKVIAYDEASGAVAAARLWWMLVWAGHDVVEVLDGGLAAWQEAGHPVRTGIETRPAARFAGSFRHEMTLDSSRVLALLHDSSWRLFDARSEDRWRGRNETMDPVPGRIPGAVSAPHTGSVDARGHFLDREVLARRFEGLLAGHDPDHAVFYCGSGVTAAHAILACAHAGRGLPRLYPGSWSEWITDPARPVESG
jgi:thiosulfate/3-mercaptopyruvate sulfurtransferase